MRPILVERTIDCRSDVRRVWSAITDTERINRAVGNNPIALQPNSDGSAARYLARTRLGGFDVTYEERPFEWEYLKRFSIVRRMRNGPVAALEFTSALETLESGLTRVVVRIGLTPRIALLAPVVRFNANVIADRMREEVHRIDALLVADQPVVSARVSSSAAAALERAHAELREIPGLLHVERLVELVRTGDDFEVSRLRPYALADRWEVPRREVLATCLRAVKAGLLELRWEIVCPSCLTVASTVSSLAALPEHGACQLCELQLGLELDESVVATFAPPRPVRNFDIGPYCTGGPARTPHVLSQAILPPDGETSLRAPIEEGRYRLVLRGGRVAPVEVTGAAPSTLEIVPADEPQRLVIAPAGELRVRNPFGDERHVKLERLDWARQAATARDVTALAEFRRDFSSEVLKPGVQLKVSRMGLMFSDLSDSTQLYADAGDAAAFRLVQDHFELLVPLIERHGGAVVKTIGDAIMAAFADDRAGLAACREMLTAFGQFRRAREGGMRTHLKLGLFSGPCFVITANGALDYFGQTVNIAARLQGQARSGELVIESSFADAALREGALTEAEVIERYEATLKGVEHPIQVARIVDAEGARTRTLAAG